MKDRNQVGFALAVLLLSIGFLGCGLEKYNWHFGLGTTANDSVTTETSVDRVKDGVLPAEPTTPEKPKTATGKKAEPGSKGTQTKGTESPPSDKPKSP